MAAKKDNESHIEKVLSDADKKKHEAYETLMKKLEEKQDVRSS